MKLYMKQKVFSIKDKFTIQDETGADKYFIEGKLISLGKKLTVKDSAGNELALVKQKLISFMPKFTVEMGGNEVAIIKKKVTAFKPKYIIEGPNWEVSGDFFGHDYVITEGGAPVVSIHKKWMAWGDTFELDVVDESREVLAMAVVLAIDCVMDNGDNNAISLSR